MSKTSRKSVFPILKPGPIPGAAQVSFDFDEDELELLIRALDNYAAYERSQRGAMGRPGA